MGVCLNHLRDLLLADYGAVARPNPFLKVLYLAAGLGHEWVIVFFVLSGYLIGGSVLGSFAADKWSWRTYLLNRLTRLYTVLLPALLLGGLLDIAGIHFFHQAGVYGGRVGSHELTYAVQTHLSLKILLGNYLYLQGITVPVFGSNGPLWSLANEFWYYLAFPLAVLSLLPRRRLLRRLAHVLLLALVLVFVGREIALLGLIWLMGVAIHFLPALRIRRAIPRRVLILVAVGACAGMLTWAKLSRVPAVDWLLGLVVTAMIYVLLASSNTAPSRIYRWTARVLSRSSYTLYLVHFPFVIFLAAWVGRIRLAPDRPQLLLMMGMFVAAMTYAQLVWFAFEKRTDRLREWLKPFVIRSARKAAPASHAPVSS